MPPACLFLMGPTASGKTDLAVELAARFPCDIVSVDSALVYRAWTSVPPSPGPDVLAAAPHRLIDICDAAESYSAARFRDDALREMAEISARGQDPAAGGGHHALFSCLAAGALRIPRGGPGAARAARARGARTGLDALHRRLAAVDPVAARRVHPNDPQRIQRALEVYEITGRPMSGCCAGAESAGSPYRVLKLVRAPNDRGILHDRIGGVSCTCWSRGFEEEVRTLWSRGDLTPSCPPCAASVIGRC